MDPKYRLVPDRLADLVYQVMSVVGDRSEVTLGNVTFFVDASGPFAGQFSFSLPIARWDLPTITRELTARLVSLPATN